MLMFMSIEEAHGRQPAGTAKQIAKRTIQRVYGTDTTTTETTTDEEPNSTSTMQNKLEVHERTIADVHVDMTLARQQAGVR